MQQALGLQTQKSVGATLVVAASFFYASYGIWTLLMGDFFGGYTASALRSVLVVGILVVAAYYFKKFEPLELAKNWRKLLGMVAVSTLVWGLLYYSVLQVGMGLSLSVNYFAIVIGMLFFGWVLAGERLTKTKAVSAVLGIVGLGLVFVPTASGVVAFIPLAAALISGLAIAVNTILAKQLTYNTTQATIFLWVTSVVANAPLAFMLQEPMPVFDFRMEWVYLIFFALASVLASWLLLAGLKYIDAGTAGILGLLEIVFSVAFGFLLFGERIELVAFAGIVLIIGATAYPYFQSMKGKT